MKSIALALVAVLAVTSAAWSEAATLRHSQLVSIVDADIDPNTFPGFVGANIVLDLRKIPLQPYFAAASDHHGIAFTCQTDFADFAGGPVAATLVSYERGEDGRDFVKLGGCTAQER
jgi:hypothetical protein